MKRQKRRKSRQISVALVLIMIIMSFSTSVYAKNLVQAPSKLAAHHAYTVIDARTGQTLVSDKSNQKVYPASTTKLMTAMVILDKISINKNIKITKKMINSVPKGCSNYGLKAGERYKAGTLINMLLICSAGDAATSLAISAYGSIGKCVTAMNKKCKTLGLKHTVFDNPIGLDIGNGYKKCYTTAGEMAIITRAAMSRNVIKKVVARKKYLVRQANGKKGREIKSTNHFYSDVEYSKNLYTIIGSKTGTTAAAGSVFAATAIDNAGREVICVYMGSVSSKDTFNDIRRLLDSVYKAQKKGKIALSTGKQEINAESNLIEKEYIEDEEEREFNLGISIRDKDSAYELGKNSGKITYESSDESIASVDEEGNVTIYSKGSVEISIKVAKTLYHKAASKKITLVITDEALDDAA